MKEKNSTITVKMRTLIWAIKTAWKINCRVLLLWVSFSAILAILPAISLVYNRETVAQLSAFITSGIGSFEDILPIILKFGFILMVITLSSRISTNFIRNMMYESYFLGMQELLMNNIQRFEISELLRRELNDEFNFVIRRSNSLNNVISSICVIGAKLISIISLLIVAWTLSRMVFFITFLYVILVFILNSSFAESTRYNHVKYRRAESRAFYFQKMPEEKGMAKEIRTYNCGEDVVKSWKNVYMQAMDMEIKRQFAIELRNFFVGLGFYIFLAIVVVISLFQVANGQAGPDIFLVIYALCINIYNILSNLSRDMLGFDEGLFALERQIALLKLVSPEKEQIDELLPISDEEIVFRAENLTFCYGNGKEAINGINFTVRRGEIVALVGENGSGKTTLTKLLIALYKPTEGELYFCGHSYAEYPTGHLNKKIGVFFQDYYLFHHTLYENVAYGDINSISNENVIRDAVQKSGVTRFFHKLPEGLQTLLGKNVDKSGSELSGGEKQQVAIARAYMSDKDVVIFDEPAAMLDPMAEIEQFRNIRNKMKHKTGILISHRIGFARFADRIIMMKEGKIAEMGTHEELMAQGGLYAAFFKEQSQWYDDEGIPEFDKGELK